VALPSLLGLISDTHGLLRPEAVAALDGVDLILHAGDVGKADILDALWRIAPVIAVRGNVDKGAWAERLHLSEVVEAAGTSILMLHDVNALDLDPAVAGFDIVISGHSHKPGEIERDGVLYINPGSAGPRRFKLPVTVAKLDLKQSPWQAEIIDLSRTGDWR
jgi:putative phosphoesterase